MPKTETGPNSTVSRELSAGQPWLGATGPDGAKFVGWVLVQLWEPSAKSDGVNINWSGDQEELFVRAATALERSVKLHP